MLVLANAAALSDAQAQAIRAYVLAGGGLVATSDTSLADELGRPRGDHDRERARGCRRCRRGADPNAKDPPAVIVRRAARGRVVYLAAGIDAALLSYAYPYQRRILIRAIDWAAGEPFSISVDSPMAVHVTFWEQADASGRRIIVQLWNGIDSAASHGLPGMDVPLREETIPVHGIRVRFADPAPRRFHVEPGGLEILSRREGSSAVVDLPPLEVHAMLVGEY